MSTEDDDKFYFNDDLGDVRFRIEVPAQTLSFRDYMKGCQIAWRWRGRQSFWKGFLIGLVISWSIGAGCGVLYYFLNNVLFIDNGFHLSFAGWFRGSDDNLFYFSNMNALILLFYISLFGFIVHFSLTLKQYRKNHRRLYQANKSIQYGYLLEVMDKGIRCADATVSNCTHWRRVQGVANHNGMDFIVGDTGHFLWIPVGLEGYPRDEMLAFIEAKRAEVANEREKAV